MTNLLSRWRLILGKQAEEHGIVCQDRESLRIDELIGFLFHEGGKGSGGPSRIQGSMPSRSGRGGSSREGGTGPSSLTVPEWIDAVNRLFPSQVNEVMKKELIRRRGIHELMQQPELLEKIEPDMELVKTLLTHKDLLNPKTRILAKKIIDKVVQELKKRMKLQVEQTLTGAIRRDKHSPRKVFRNLDMRMTLRRNLKNYDPERQKLLVDKIYYYAAERNKRPWHVVVTVDQSGSMLDSAIFSAVMASIFAELPAMKTSLVLFDTSVVDLSDKVGQPVDVLLSIQLGGGTDITQALQYSQQLIREPARSIVVLITDFYEGRPTQDLVRQVTLMSESGIRMIGLGALGYDARPAYDRTTSRKCRKAGMDILVCTPEKLAECMSKIIVGV